MTDNLVGAGDTVFFTDVIAPFRVVGRSPRSPEVIIIEDCFCSVVRANPKALHTPDGKQVTGFREREVPRAEVVHVKSASPTYDVHLGGVVAGSFAFNRNAMRVVHAINRALGHEE